MPTTLQQFADTEVKVRYKEPLLTAALDQMLTGITPEGIHRGFRLGSIASPNVTVEADPADSDHVAAYTTADGYTLRIRRTGGNFTVDLSSLLGADKTWVLAIFAEYGTAITTFAEIRAYELSPTDEFTGAAEKDELVVLGTVTEATGVLTSQTPDYRTLAWDHVGSDAMPWEQIIENGSFEVAADAATFTASDRGFVPHWDTQYIPANHTWAITATNPHTGRYALQVTGTGTTALSSIPPDRIVAVQPGQLVRVSYWLRGNAWAGVDPAGTMGVQLNFYGPNLSLLSFQVVQDKTLSGTFAWQQFDEYIEVPSGVAWMVPSIVVYDPTTPATGSLVFDDVRVWVANGPPTIPYSSLQDGLTNGGKIVGQLGVAETNLTQFGITQDLESFVKGVLQLHKFDNLTTPPVNRYRWKRLDDEPFALRLVEGALRLEGVVGTADEAEYARLGVEVADPATCLRTNVLQAYSNAYDQVARRYHQAGLTYAALSEIINARWDESAGEFVLDETNEDAIRLLLRNLQDGVSECCSLGGLDHTAGSSFPSFTDFLKVISDISSPSPNVGVYLRDGMIRFTNASTFYRSNRVDPGFDNVLCAANTVKAWAHFTIGNGLATILEAYGFSGITYDQYTPTLTFHRAMSTTTYALAMINVGSTSITFRPITLNFSDFDFGGLTHNAGGGHAQTDFGPGTDVRTGTAIVIARQS